MLSRALLPAVLVLALAGCSSSAAPAAGPDQTPMPGGLSAQALRALLLQPGDLPSAPTRRESASVAGTTEPAPQLALCRAPEPVAAHQVASVLAKPPQPGQAQVFELVAVFADPAGASAAFDAAAAAAAACPSFSSGSTAFTLVDLGRPAVPGADAALHYRLTTPDVVRGDVRTLVRSGRFLVLLTGFGAPPGGQPPLAFQADVAAKALARLPR